MQCVAPQLPSFVSINPRVTTRSVGESITYRCDEHYLIEGSGENRLTAVCTTNGEWTRSPPRCVGEIEKCSKLFRLIVFCYRCLCLSFTLSQIIMFLNSWHIETRPLGGYVLHAYAGSACFYCIF